MPDTPASTPAPAAHQPRPDIGAVVIGRNEGARLERCLRSLAGRVAAIIYVDSDSSDASADRARALGVDVIELTQGPFTAARGRQTGLDALLRSRSSLVYVQFVDGDCIVQPAWLGAAAAFLDAHPRCGCVTGRRREEFPGATVYNALIDIDWDARPGPALYPGGDSLCRVAALRDIAGWSTDLIAGEDPDLGFKMHAAGWEVHRLADEMTLHDVAMRTFRAYWRRALRAGYCYAEVGWKHRHDPGRSWLKRTASATVYGIALPVAVACALAVAASVVPVANVPWARPAAYGAIALIALLFARLFLSLWRRATSAGAPRPLAGRYAALNVVCKLAQALGVLNYWFGAMIGRKATLIEYKPAVPPARSHAS